MEAKIKVMDLNTFDQTVCNRFDKDEHTPLLREFFSHQTNSFQILAHDPFSTTIITNRFVDGLKKMEKHFVIIIHKPPDRILLAP